MNRQFKFRIWDKKTSHFYYMYLNEMVGLTRTVHIPEGAIIQQYTGLKDKNDVEIYEGDILLQADSEEYYKVFWCKPLCCYMKKSLTNEKIEFLEIDSNVCSIAGNIFENPELIN